MPNLNPNSTNYVHSFEPNTNDLSLAMDYDGGGKPVLRTQGFGPSQTSAFGEPLAVQITPVVQLDAIYGIDDPLKFQTYSALGGSVTTNGDSEFDIVAGATTYSYGVLRSRRFLRYRPGQGAMCRFACRFTEGVANTSQRAGFFNQEGGFQVGYNGTEFGILHFYGGKTHIERLTITTAPTATQTATITLNGVAKTVSLVSESAALAAARIARETFPGWAVEAYDNIVEFLYEGALAPLGGAFTFASTGNAAGTMAVAQTGVVGTEDWIPISEWNGDYDSANFTLDPTKFNVYQINFRWLGAGEIRFSMENPLTGDFVTLHHIHWTNRYTRLHVDNPSFKIGFVAYNLGGGSVSVHGGSMLMANEGIISETTFPRGAYTSKSGLASNTMHHLGTLENPIVVNGKINTREIRLDSLSLAFQGNDPLTFVAYIDAPLLTGNHQFNSYPNAFVKASLVEGTFNAATNMPILAFTLPINGSGTFDLTPYRIVLGPNTRLSVAVLSTQSISEITASIIWQQD